MMANLVWTAILYISTLGIVLVIYRVFVADRKAEAERLTRELITRSYGSQGLGSKAVAAAPAPVPAAQPAERPVPPWQAAGRRGLIRQPTPAARVLRR
jgi:hypothetical protein